MGRRNKSGHDRCGRRGGLEFSILARYVVKSLLLEMAMKMITATEANRDFSKLLEEVIKGVSIGVTKHGKVVATVNPVKSYDDEEAQAAVREHLEMLRMQPLLGIPRGTRDELYDD